MQPEDAILLALSLIDLSLAGNLLLIVIFSGYENFVSKIDIDDHEDRPAWMGTVDFSGLKMKLIASIVAISGHRPAARPSCAWPSRPEDLPTWRRSTGAGRPHPDVAGDHPPDLRGLGRAAGPDGLSDQQDDRRL